MGTLENANIKPTGTSCGFYVLYYQRFPILIVNIHLPYFRIVPPTFLVFVNHSTIFIVVVFMVWEVTVKIQLQIKLTIFLEDDNFFTSCLSGFRAVPNKWNLYAQIQCLLRLIPTIQPLKYSFNFFKDVVTVSLL